MVFVYDANGTPLGLKYRNSTYAQSTWDSYWYERNLQGDIVAIYDNSNVKLVSYTYDAWGNHIVTPYNDGLSIVPVANNPIRYRGYYYDTDLGLYYLQTRYYDSNIGRFINADGYISTGTGLLGYNMYAYCNNNPVMYVDPSGTISFLLGVAIVVVGYAIISNVANVIESENTVKNSTVEPMDNDEYKNLSDPEGDTHNLSEDKKIAYIRAYRENHNDTFSKNWTESEMLREMEYHEKFYKIVVFLGSDPDKEGSLADRLEHVDFEENQTLKTYLRRFFGNVIP